MRVQKWWLFAGMMVVLSGCATQVPAPIAAPPSNNPSIAQVRAQPSDYQGIKARWGGTIAEVENREQETVLLIVGLPLDDDGRPQVDAASQGRFMAKINGFLDPVVYATGRMVTVAGTITGSESRQIGSYPYLYPIVAVEHYYLWPRRQRTSADCYPCYDSFFWHGPMIFPGYRGYVWPYW